MTVTQLGAPASRQFALDVLEGLSHPSQKWLSAQYFYDDVGSALFEAITALPEYGLTRADARVLRLNAAAIVGNSREPLHIVELGSGSGLKTRWLLEAAVTHLDDVRYSPIDVSAFALELCRTSLEMIPGVRISPQHATYLDGVRQALAGRPAGERVLILFLGSTIGNFTRAGAPEFLTSLRSLLSPGDGLLLGTDLVKPVHQSLLAYDDPAGVTAAFNRNLLARLNRELGANFDVRSFDHEVRWDNGAARVEMHLSSTKQQNVWIEALDRSFCFEAGETIWTESSYKFSPEGIRELATASGFFCANQWIDAEWPFAESLLLAA